MAEQFEFLSAAWMAAARSIRDEMPEAAPGAGTSIRMNQIVTDAPFGDGQAVHVHLDTSGGELHMDEGHLGDPDLTVTLDWDTAKAVFVGMDVQLALQAFMAGRIKVTGDITKLMELQQAEPDPRAAAIALRIREITA